MSTRDEKTAILLEAAAAIYARTGDVTARELAAETGMNVASLNYYFGSKENLMEMIEQKLLEVFIQEITITGGRQLAAEERLYQLLLGVSRRLSENPGLARHFVEMLIAGESRIYQLLELAVGRQSPVYNVFSAILAEAGITDNQEIWHRLIIGISALAPTLIISLGNNVSAVETESLRQSEFINTHIRTLAQMLICGQPDV